MYAPGGNNEIELDVIRGTFPMKKGSKILVSMLLLQVDSSGCPDGRDLDLRARPHFLAPQPCQRTNPSTDGAETQSKAAHLLDFSERGNQAALCSCTLLALDWYFLWDSCLGCFLPIRTFMNWAPRQQLWVLPGAASGPRWTSTVEPLVLPAPPAQPHSQGDRNPRVKTHTLLPAYP